MDNLKQDEHYVALLVEHQLRLTSYIRALVPHRADADEVLQNVNLFLLNRANEFRPGAEFGPWALRIAYFHVLTYRKQLARKRSRFSDALVDQLAADSFVVDDNSRRRAVLEGCLQKLPEKDRQLIQLRYETAVSTREVAQQLGRSLKGIYESLARIRLRLFECVQQALATEGNRE
jgi:RNA polymerase sigma-70 factor (ECF subfamily)